MSGGVAAMTLAIVAFYLGEVSSSKWIWTAGAISWVMAGYSVWAREHGQRMYAEAKTRKDTPDFAGHIDWMAFADPVGGNCPTLICLNAMNRGSVPSILQHYGVSVTEPGKLEREVPIREPRQGESISLVSATGKGIVVFGDDMMRFKAYPTPIPAGGGRRGFVMCQIPAGLPEGTRYSVSFHDISGKRHTCDLGPTGRAFSDVSEVGNWPDVKIIHRARIVSIGCATWGAVGAPGQDVTRTVQKYDDAGEIDMPVTVEVLGDPARHQRKELRVQYRIWKGEPQQINVAEGQRLSLP